MNYKDDIRIDVTHFDTEWIRHADLVYQYGVEMAEAKRLLDKQEERVNISKAKAILNAFETVKSPADKVKATADLDENYLGEIRELQRLKHQFNLIKAAYDAILVKKSTMENYLKGQLSGIWGAPIEPNREEVGGEPTYTQEAAVRINKQATENAISAGSRKRTRKE